jgi:enediyne biosynthesis protein E4
MHVFACAAALAAFFAAGAVVYEIVPPAKSGIAFVHDNARSDRKYLPESMGPGVAVFDYNNDGWMDLYFTNSGPSDFFRPSRPLRNALYRNDGDGTFTDVTVEAGVPGRDFGIGVTTCDYNDDGRVDLFVTNYGRPVLYRNNGDGTFTDVTRRAGLDVPGLWTVAVFFDFDNNGTEDLFLGHFVEYRKELERDCAYNGIPHYCYPLSYDPWPSRFYRNNGDGTFTDISAETGIGRHPGKTFGAVATDINRDGWLDLFVANDSVPNFLFLNNGRGAFEEIGLEANVAYSADGAARSGMGVDAADFDNDGWEDLFVANFNRERFSIYRNKGGNTFSDESGPTGIGMATQMYSGWGVKFFDFDYDMDLDLVVCNGHPDDLIESISTTLTYKEPVLLFANRGGKFVNLGTAAGEAFGRHYPARGLALGDLDNDGYPEIVVANSGEAPLLLRHTGRAKNRWLGLHLKGMATGARITWSAVGKTRSRLKTAGGSYLSAHDPRELLGLGPAEAADWVEVHWPAPSQRVDRFESVEAGRYYSLTPGGQLEAVTYQRPR